MLILLIKDIPKIIWIVIIKTVLCIIINITLYVPHEQEEKLEEVIKTKDVELIEKELYNYPLN